MTDTITVQEVPDSKVIQKCAEFVTDDWREGPDGLITGHVVMTLTNGRALVIGSDGITDREDWPTDPSESCPVPASVNWEELLQLLDGWRSARRMMEVN